MVGEELKIDLVHALEDFLGMYQQQPSEVVLIESIANSIDGGASILNIIIDRNDKTYSLIDNGNGMSKDNFESYHTVALSSKDKSKGIGFAGVGAKIYLASWEGATVITETNGPDGKFRSRMYRNGKKILYEYEPPTFQSQGTSYKVTLSEADFSDLYENCTNYILYWYNWAIKKRLKIFLNGSELKPWDPEKIYYDRGTINLLKQNFPFEVWLTKDDLPQEKRNIEYTVYGKRVKCEIPAEVMWNVKQEYKNKIYCMIEADPISRFLTSNKEDFQKNQFRNLVFSRAREEVYTFAKKHDLLFEDEQTSKDGNTIIDTDITDELSKILETNEFSWLNPWSFNRGTKTNLENPEGTVNMGPVEGIQNVKGNQGGNGSGGGIDVPGPEEGRSKGEDHEGKYRGTETLIKRRGLGIVIVELEEDPREGWIQLDDKAVAVNYGHAMAKKILKANNRKLERYHLSRVIISVLLKSAGENELKDMSISEAFSYESEILKKLFASEGSKLSL